MTYTAKHTPAPPYSPPSPLSPTSTSNSDALPSSSPLSRSLSPPPGYNASDPLIRDFHLRGHFIYATSTGTPQYQLKPTLTSTGRAHQLHLRRLLPSEIRRAHRKPASPQACSSLTPNPLTRSTTAPTAPASPTALTPLTPTRSNPAVPPQAPAAAAEEEPLLPYDDDLTLYAATLYPTGALELRGRRASSLPGSVVVSPSPFSSSVSASTTFWHRTRNSAFDALDPAHEARIQKYGYRGEDEWKREVLFAAKGLWDALRMLESRIDESNNSSTTFNQPDSRRIEMEVKSLKLEIKELKSENAASKESHEKLNREYETLSKDYQVLWDTVQALDTRTEMVPKLIEKIKAVREVLKLAIMESEVEGCRVRSSSPASRLPENGDGTASGPSPETSSHRPESGTPYSQAGSFNSASRRSSDCRMNAFLDFIVQQFEAWNGVNLIHDTEAKQRFRSYALKTEPSLLPGDQKLIRGVELAFWKGMELRWVLSGAELDALVRH
ncbi:hypothetical protein SLS56_000734 [Neofusicoccum ribis]|uniref:Uncharacterized protein n=1 Tax=Neofusicoccum ribis TaxID=45134 RepID=A0ABR3TBZ3_9PEZI